MNNILQNTKPKQPFSDFTKSVKNNLFNSNNSIMSKFMFLIMAIIVFIIILKLGTTFLTFLFAPKRDPIIIDGLKDAKKRYVVGTDPNFNKSVPIMRSKNEEGGIEFTWSVWINVKDLVYKNGTRKHIFHKGSENIKENGTFSPNNAPGLYIHETKNNLIIAMNTYENIIEEVEINEFPLNKWVNVAIRLRGKTMDVFINGVVVVRHKFSSVPKQNYGPVFVNMNGGYDGELSELRYYDSALSGNEIVQITQKGPNLRRHYTDGNGIMPYYLSLKWYFQNARENVVRIG